MGNDRIEESGYMKGLTFGGFVAPLKNYSPSIILSKGESHSYRTWPFYESDPSLRQFINKKARSDDNIEKKWEILAQSPTENTSRKKIRKNKKNPMQSNSVGTSNSFVHNGRFSSEQKARFIFLRFFTFFWLFFCVFFLFNVFPYTGEFVINNDPFVVILVLIIITNDTSLS